MKIIETKRLSKTYRRVRKGEGLKESTRSLVKREFEEKEAVKELDLSVEEGEFIGLIGPNGAGKGDGGLSLRGQGGETAVCSFEDRRRETAACPPGQESETAAYPLEGRRSERSRPVAGRKETG